MYYRTAGSNCNLTCALSTVFQHCVTSLLWDPTGQVIATCANEAVVKVWQPGDGHWDCVQSLQHASEVCIIAWCSVVGKGEHPMLMLARLSSLS